MRYRYEEFSPQNKKRSETLKKLCREGAANFGFKTKYASDSERTDAVARNRRKSPESLMRAAAYLMAEDKLSVKNINYFVTKEGMVYAETR